MVIKSNKTLIEPKSKKTPENSDDQNSSYLLSKNYDIKS
jgi:hypothetical protein